MILSRRGVAVTALATSLAVLPTAVTVADESNSNSHANSNSNSGSHSGAESNSSRKPQVLTLPPTLVGSDHGTLQGRVHPLKAGTTYRFEYGTTTRYGRLTGTASAGSGASAVSVGTNVSGLQPHTRYHYRVVATNAAGTARGRDRTFTTLRNPRGFTASASPNPAPWGGTTTITGRLSGQGIGGTTVALERQDFPFTGPFYLVGTKAASSNGSFSFKVGPLWALARLRLTSRTTIVAASPIVEVRNALRVGLRVRRLSGGRVRLQGAVSPRVPRGRASLQKRSPRGRWVVIRRAAVHALRGGRSRYRFTVRRAGTYRVVVLPRDAFAHVRGISRERPIAR
jgi:hypothetical protein